MDFKRMADALAHGVQFAEGLLPLLGELPEAKLADTAAQAVAAVAETAANVAELVAEGKIVAAAEDQSQVQGYRDRLRAVNDQLMEYVEKS